MVAPDPNKDKGHFIPSIGPMNSGKTEKMVEDLRKLEMHAKQNVVCFTLASNTRDGMNQIKGNNGKRIPAYMIPRDDPEQILDIIKHEDKKRRVDVIGIEEISFFNHDIVYVVDKLMEQNRLTRAVGLDKDFRGEPIDVMTYLKDRVKPELLPHIYLNSYCKMIRDDKQCGNLANYTVRLREYSEPKVGFVDKSGEVVDNLGFAPYYDTLLLIEDTDEQKKEKKGIEEVVDYTAACEDCFKIPFKEETLFVYSELLKGKKPEDLSVDKIDKIVNTLVEDKKLKPKKDGSFVAFEYRKDLRTGLYIPC